MPFNLGGFCSFDDILTKLNVDVHIVSGIPKRVVPPFLKEALEFWTEKVGRIKEHIEKSDDESEKEFLEEEMRKVSGIIQFLQGQMFSWSSMKLRGLYDSERKIIELYPEEMREEYDGKRMNELLVSTLAHETMHAYFDRNEHSRYAYVPTIEEPLAEFGMLLYLNETGSGYLKWAYDDVRKKHTCYRYGADILDQHMAESFPYPTRQFLEEYKIPLPDYSVLMKLGMSGKIVLSSAKKSGLGVDETPVGGKHSRPPHTSRKKSTSMGWPSFPVAPAPYPTPTAVFPKGRIVEQANTFTKFALKVFRYLEENSLIDQLDQYIRPLLNKKSQINSIFDDYDIFKLRGVLYNKKDFTTPPPKTHKDLLKIDGKEYYLSKHNWSDGSTHNHLEDLVNMLKYVYDDRFEIRKEVDEKGAKVFVLIEYLP